jgi:hypothetical protein
MSLLVARAQPTTDAVANYVTARFGATPSRVTPADVANVRSQN